MTLEQQLLKKKSKAETVLADEMESKEWFINETKKGYDEFRNTGLEMNIDDSEIKIEALQEFIEGIDNYLREKKFEPMSPKDLELA